MPWLRPIRRPRTRTLLAIATAIRREAPALRAANELDLSAAKAAGMEAAMLDRLALSDKAIETMALGLEQIAALPDPIGEISNMKYRPSGSSWTNARAFGL